MKGRGKATSGGADQSEVSNTTVAPLCVSVCVCLSLRLLHPVSPFPLPATATSDSRIGTHRNWYSVGLGHIGSGTQ